MTDKEKREIYETYLRGDHLTDEQVKKGAKFFRELHKDLSSLGPRFSFAAQEVGRIAYDLGRWHQYRVRHPRHDG